MIYIGVLVLALLIALYVYIVIENLKIAKDIEETSKEIDKGIAELKRCNAEFRKE